MKQHRHPTATREYRLAGGRRVRVHFVLALAKPLTSSPGNWEAPMLIEPALSREEIDQALNGAPLELLNPAAIAEVFEFIRTDNEIQNGLVRFNLAQRN